jgi:CCR4-NOT transcription complex subunit 1
MFMPVLLKQGPTFNVDSQKEEGWQLMLNLLALLFRFLEPFVGKFRSTELNPILELYKGILRVFIVLYRDFPDFFVDHYFRLASMIPVECLQLRNLVLSADGNVHFMNSLNPNPNTDPSKLNNYPMPKLHPHHIQDLGNVKTFIDDYLTPSGENETMTITEEAAKEKTFLTTLLGHFSMSDVNLYNMNNYVYNLRVLNSLVLYFGIVAIDSIYQEREESIGVIYRQKQVEGTANGKPPSLVMNWETTLRTPQSEKVYTIFFTLMKTFPPEGRHHVINAMANHLRYVNAHTMYFSNLLIKLFKEVEEDFVREQIIRVLVERNASKGPVPYGIQTTCDAIVNNKDNPSLNDLLHSHSSGGNTAGGASGPGGNGGMSNLEAK